MSEPKLFGLPQSYAKHFCEFHGWLAFRYVFRIGWFILDLGLLGAICSARSLIWGLLGITSLLLVLADQIVRDRSVSELLQCYWLRFCNQELRTQHCISCKTHPPPINPGGPDADSH